jgi:glycosyltransferase involved in cell wall biosynthesis
MNEALKRIAILAETAPPCEGGGIAAAHDNLARMLRKQGHDVHVFTFLSQGLCADQKPHITRVAAPAMLERSLFRLGRLAFRLLDRGRTAYQTADILSAQPGAARLSRPLRSFAPDLVILPDQGAPGLLIDRPPNAQMILVSHHNPTRFLNDPLLGNYSTLDANTAVFLENAVLRKIDRVVCPSSYMQAAFSKTYKFLGPVDVIPNLIDEESLATVEPFDFSAKAGFPAGIPVVCIPSAGSRYKGARFTAELVRRLTAQFDGNIGFFLSGSIGDDIRHELAQSLPNAHIFMPGKVSHRDNLGFLRGCTIVVSPTLVENFSMAFLEALFSSVPVVTFDVGGNCEMIEDGLSGFVVPRLDVNALCARAVEALRPPILGGLRQGALNSARTRFNPSLWLPRLVNSSGQ